MSDNEPMKAIYCKFQIAGMHFHAEADDFEGNLHRHLFQFIVTVNAANAEDSLNALRLRQLCLDQFSGFHKSVFDFDDMQALDIAVWLGRALYEDMFKSERGVRVDVSEDGENGAVASFGPEPTYLPNVDTMRF